ncbi:hypothetical protein TNCV_3723941 [Trichonephila clavipes]|nr:hypothetical protein TNCV_3723941 [Trichonephila clavipes]
MSVKTIEKRRKRSLPLYLMLRNGRYETWITYDEALFHLSFTTGKTKIQYISRRKRRKDAAVMKNARWSSGVMCKQKVTLKDQETLFLTADLSDELDRMFWQDAKSYGEGRSRSVGQLVVARWFNSNVKPVNE